MRAVVVTRHGPPEVLAVQQRPDPVPGSGQVRIAVEAAGLNFADVLGRAGMYPDAPRPPCVLGYEVAGRVDAIGPGVDGYGTGDRVIAHTHFGGQAELAVAGVSDTIPVPSDMSASEAAAIPVNYGTAYAGLVLMAGTKPGERVLIHAAAGGVGTACVQLARHLGAEVIGTASASKHEHVRRLGAGHVIDYHTQDVAAEVMRITGGEGVDVIMDALGPKSFRVDWRLLRAGGRLIAFGASQMQTGEKRDIIAALRTVTAFPFSTMPWWKGPAMMYENRGVFGLNLKHWWDREGNLARILTPLRELMQSGVIRPVVDSTFPFHRAADAHRRLMAGGNVGKVLLTPD
jgi:NADPH:quinone reductase-like Zn-dependent oxidoreductase